MSDTPDDPRQPNPGGRGAENDPDDPTSQQPIELPPLADLPPLGDLPALGDEDPPKRRFLSSGRLVVAAVAAVVLIGGAAFALKGGGDAGDDDDGGVASVDAGEGDTDSDGSADSDGKPDAEEMQDAMLEYAQCMRDHGIDMPDPEFDQGGGGFSITGEAGSDGKGPGGDEWAAADEACASIMEDVRGNMTPPDPEEMARLQDQMVEMAQCMREKGYDFPDPEVTADGGIMIGMGNADDPGSGIQPGQEDQFQADQEECNEQAGLEGPDGAPMSAVPGGGK